MRQKRKPFWFLRRPSAEIAADVDAELHDHLERRTAALIRDGFAPDEARAEARRRFVNTKSGRTGCAGG